MGRSAVRDWLAHKVRRDARLSLGAAALLVPLGLLVVFVTFWAIYGVIWFGFRWLLPLSHTGVILASGAIVALLFVGNARTSREYLEDLQFDLDEGRHIRILMRPVIGLSLLPAFAGRETVRSEVKMVTTLLFSGPRLLALAWGLSRKGRRLQALNVDACSRVLSLLLKSGSRVPVQSLFETRPPLDPHEILPQLRDIDGVVFLNSAPPGLTLAPLLADEITEFRTADSFR